MPLSLTISTRLHHQHEALPELVAGLTEHQLKKPVNPGKWSVFEQIAHLAAYQPVFLDRLQQIRNQINPSFGRYVADNDPAFTAYLAMSLENLLQSIHKLGAEIAVELDSWRDDGLARKGLHARYGLMDVAGWSEFYLLHEAHHLFAIFMMTQDLRAEGERLP